ncbi:MAG: PKD domain-containing protein, partial [Methanoculleus sp.]|nr:PKD domain-containing protein [Methanoculleus sp.]
DYTFTGKDAGGNDAKDSDADLTTGRTAKITLKAEEKQLQWDAGMIKQAPPAAGQIGDLVWEDKNGNGLQDGGEAGLKDVTVKLLDGTGKPVNDAAGKPREVKTDANGEYLFDNLAAGDYIVEFSLPKDYTFTKKDAGDDTKDSDADQATGRTAKITLKAGEKQLQWDAGLVKTAGQIAVTKKTNGQVAKNPPGPTIKVGDKVTWTYEVTNPGTGQLTNVKVTDDKAGPIAGPPTGDDGNGKLDPGETWTYTKDDTAKDTSGMPGGSYKNTVTVTADDQTAKQVTATDVSHYTSSPAGGGCACTADFTSYISHRAPPAGAQNPDPLSLTIYHFQGSVQTSNCLAGVAPAKWEWDFGDGKGWQDLGQNPTHTFATAKTYDVKLRVTLSNGVTCEVMKKVTVEAPPLPEGKGSIGDFVWNDKNENGKQDSGEKGLAGVVVTLLDKNDNPINGENGQPRRITTKEDGKYVFDKLPEGKYRVMFDPPQGNWIYSPMDNVPNDDNLDSDPGISGRTGIIVIKEGALVQSNWDAGFYNHAMQGTGQIGDLVWEDENENGIQDGTEKGVSGVSVTLMDDKLMQIYAATTDANGKYLFTDLTAGDYYVVFGHRAAQRDAKFTRQNVDANTKDDIDSDASMIGRTDKITLQDNQKQLQWDAGLIFITQTTIGPIFQGQGSITGVTFDDRNGNGVLDEGESGVSAVGVTLLAGGAPGESIPETGKRSSAFERETSGRTYSDDGRSDGISFAVVTDVGSLTAVNKTTTDERGAYAFTNLTIGEYYLMFDPPEGYTFAIPEEGSELDPETGIAGPIEIVENDTKITLNIGFNRTPGPTVGPAVGNSTIGDLVWNDTNGNGIQDEGEGGVADATVELYYANETLANSTTTDPDGAYLFTALPAGEYYLVFGLPEGFNFTIADQGADDATDSDADPATGRTANITLAENETQLDWDAGANLTAAEAAETATIGDFVWNDTNGNALQDEGEAGVSGVTVRLLDENGDQVTDAAGTAVETTTGEDGRYALEGVVGTTYIIEVVAPDGLTFVTPDAGDDTRDSDVGVETGRTEPFVLAGDDLTRDAGLNATVTEAETATVGGVAWNDTNADGARDAGEAGVLGVAVTLLGADGTDAGTATT